MHRGFTIVEMITVLALMAVIGAGATVLVRGYANRNDVPATAELVISALSTAQSRARTGLGDDTWGVKLNNNEIVVFKGASYATRVVASDEKHGLSSGATFSGLTEIVFSKLYGYPSVTGNIIVNAGVISKTINLNAKGLVTR